MVLVILSRVPTRLAGFLTLWLMEVQDGVYVGVASARVRVQLWQRIVADIGKGKALMVWQARNAQGLEFASHNHQWDVVDYDGIQLVRKPTEDEQRHRRALETYSELTSSEINKVMRKWLKKHHPGASAPRTPTTSKKLDLHRTGNPSSEQQSMQDTEHAGQTP
jgi:CRISPR-associated protein Cas2